MEERKKRGGKAETVWLKTTSVQELQLPEFVKETKFYPWVGERLCCTFLGDRKGMALEAASVGTVNSAAKAGCWGGGIEAATQARRHWGGSTEAAAQRQLCALNANEAKPPSPPAWISNEEV